jgi:glycosyltransferase involved in cell wall biosynthesis
VTAVTVDVAGAAMGGAARYLAELEGYLAVAGRRDVRVIGSGRRLTPQWLVRRETARPGRRRVALNNVSFCGPGGVRWTLLGNALHYLSPAEAARLDPALRAQAARQARVARLAARRSDVLVAPCAAMADRVATALPGLGGRLTVRPHPVTAAASRPPDGPPVILVPVLFAPYKDMRRRLTDLARALDAAGSPAVIAATATAAEAGPALAACPRVRLLGRVSPAALRPAWATCRAVYFPTGLESFGYPLAEARAAGRPVLARDTAQNREIAGAALVPCSPGNPASLPDAVARALATAVAPDPAPFDPVAYFGWLLGDPA